MGSLLSNDGINPRFAELHRPRKRATVIAIISIPGNTGCSAFAGHDNRIMKQD
jgi:hypothetical protein